MYHLFHKLLKITGIALMIAFIMRFYCPLSASYPLERRSIQAPSINVEAEKVTKSLRELKSYHAFNKCFKCFSNSLSAVEKIEREVIAKLSRGALTLPIIFAGVCALIKHNKTEKPESTALIRVYQATVLQHATNDPSKKSDVDHIISFIKSGADVTKIDKEGNNALHRAAEKGHETAVQFLIPLFAKNGLLNMPTVDERTALHYAAKNGNVECIKALLGAGANLTATDRNRYNALHYAALYGKVTATEFLIPLFARIGLLEARTFHERTALLNAAYSGDVKCIKALLDAGAKLPVADKECPNALHISAQQSREAAVQLLAPLFAKSGLIDATMSWRQTALHEAAYNGNVECVKALLDAGANVTAANKCGKNALHLAAQRGHGAVVHFLMPLFAKNGILEEKDLYGGTALHCAASSGEVKCIQELLNAGAILTAADRDGLNPLHYAAVYKKTAATLFLAPLFSLYGLLDTPSADKQTALECAHREGHEKIVALLWILGAKRPMSEKEVPSALQSALETIQSLTSDEFDGLIAALGALHEKNIIVPISLTAPFSSDQELFLPLRETILKRLRPIQQKIRHGLPSPSLLPEIENIIEEYLIGKVPRPQLLILNSDKFQNFAPRNEQNNILAVENSFRPEPLNASSSSSSSSSLSSSSQRQ